ncbi:MAG: M48 family metallopeptidase [Scytolyngbya sp. HA4215-MV1]|jgi:Zn-dependent protease with chaperone function|nr:M48 family metallopeptidase [Scytolyngbya sp. HA4215-MV1]
MFFAIYSQRGFHKPPLPTLDQEPLEALVRQLESYACKSPQGYRLRVTLLALLGYAYIGGIFGGLVLLFFKLVAFQSVVLILVGLISLFWIRMPPPKGVRVDRTHCPLLFAELDQLSAALKTPTIHQVVITTDLNAAVLQAPKLGIFGWYTNYLLLGLPLMRSVTPKQFRATLAHELGHLSGNHSRFSGWIYRVRYAWLKLSQQGDRPPLLMYPFFKWYEPFFRAYTFVLSRSNEYVADRCAAEYAGVQNAAEDLIQIHLQGTHAARIWRDFYQQKAQHAKVPANAVSHLITSLERGIAPESVQAWLELELARQTGYEDTHPCLSERLTAYGYQSDAARLCPLPFPVEQSASKYFLAEEERSITALLDAQWKAEHTKFWQTHYARRQEREAFFQQLQAQAEGQLLTVEQSLKLAMLTAEFVGSAAAIAQLASLTQKFPAHAAIKYELGKLRLQQQQAAGLADLLAALQHASYLLIPGFEFLYAALLQQGKQALAQSYLQQLRQQLPIWQRSQKERETVTGKVCFLPHSLPETEIRQITWHLTRYPEVREAYLVQRQVKYLPENPAYVLGVVCQFDRQNPMTSLRNWELVDVLGQTLCLSAEVRVIPLEGRREIYQALRKTSTAKIV